MGVIYNLKILSTSNEQVYEMTSPGGYMMDGQGTLRKGCEQTSGR